MDSKLFLYKNIPSDARKTKVNSSKWFGLQIIVANSNSLTLIVYGISVIHESDAVYKCPFSNLIIVCFCVTSFFIFYPLNHNYLLSGFLRRFCKVICSTFSCINNDIIYHILFLFQLIFKAYNKG